MKSEAAAGVAGVKRKKTLQTEKSKKRKEDDRPKDFGSFMEDNPDWNQLKVQMKTLREQRKKIKKRSLYDTATEAKKLWESLRQRKCSKQKREEICLKLASLMKGNVNKMVRSHDTARIVQCVLKLGSDSVKEEIFGEMEEDLVALSKAKYTKHAVSSLMQHCSADMKRRIIERCKGKLVSLTCNKVSAPLVQEMYKSASRADRAAMIKEFYDTDLDSGTADEVTSALMNKTSKTISTLLSKQHCLKLHLVHSVLYDYLQKCEQKDRTEILDNLKEHFRWLLSSKDGVKLFSMILWQSTTKEKKAFVKEFKADLKELAVGEHSSMAILFLIDSVDDTVLVKKALIPVLLDNLDDIAGNAHGRKIIIYLMVHRDPKYFHPEDIEWLSQSDTSPNTKKDSKLRIQEIREALLQPLADRLTDNPKFWFSNSSIAMVTLSIAITLTDSLRPKVYSSIVNFITDADATVKDKGAPLPVIEHPAVHMVLKKLMAHDKNIKDSEGTFSFVLIQKLDGEIMGRWIGSNRGCFTLLAIIKTNIKTVCRHLWQKISESSIDLEALNNVGGLTFKEKLLRILEEEV